MSGLTESTADTAMATIVERRWWGHYFNEVTVADADDLEELEAAWEAHCPPEAWLFEYVVNCGVEFPPEVMWPWIPDLRALLNSKGFELAGGARPAKMSPHRFVGRLAAGAPTAAAYDLPATPHDRWLVGSIFVEVLPLTARAEHVAAAAELLPPMPVLDADLELPNYHEPIIGPLAEWVSDGRAVIEMLEVVTT